LFKNKAFLVTLVEPQEKGKTTADREQEKAYRQELESELISNVVTGAVIVIGFYMISDTARQIIIGKFTNQGR
jgi:F0F1-type ATP synthase assembly protein I